MTSELDDLRSSVRSVVDRRFTPAALRTAIASERGYDAELWRVLCDQVGVAALIVPEDCDGLAAGVAAAQVVAEELGRHLIPSPFLGSSVFATALLGADTATASGALAELASGTEIAAVLCAGVDFDDRPIRVRDSALHGTAQYVLDGDHARYLIAVTDDGAYLVDTGSEPTESAGVARRHTPSMDLTRRFAEVSLDGARGARIDCPPDAVGHALDLACAVLAAEQVGAAARALEVTVEYTGSRVQFGRPIGSFQALKHRMANLYVLVESARSAARSAALALDAGDEDAARHVATAKTYCSEAFSTVAAEMIQLHGGIGITWEHDAHLYFKRAHSSSQLFGDPALHLSRQPLMRSADA